MQKDCWKKNIADVSTVVVMCDHQAIMSLCVAVLNFVGEIGVS